MKRKLTALVCCLAMAFGWMAVGASPAAADHEQSCHYTYVSQQVQTGTRTETRAEPIIPGPGVTFVTYEVPIYTTVYGQVRTCTTVLHPVWEAPDCFTKLVRQCPGGPYATWACVWVSASVCS